MPAETEIKDILAHVPEWNNYLVEFEKVEIDWRGDFPTIISIGARNIHFTGYTHRIDVELPQETFDLYAEIICEYLEATEDTNPECRDGRVG